MKKEIQLKSSTHPCHHKPPSNTQSSSKRQRRFKPIRRIHPHVKPCHNQAQAPALPNNHLKTFGAAPIPESKPDIPSILNLEDYLDDIDQYMCQVDESFHQHSESQLSNLTLTNITLDMRKILIRWLVKVAARFRCKSETLHLCIQFIDMMLINRSSFFDKNNFQLLGITCLFIACKYNEIYSMEAVKYIEMCESIFTVTQMFQMEGIILSQLGFNLQVPTIQQFTGRMIAVCGLQKPHAYIVKSLADMIIFDFHTFNSLRKSELLTAIIYFVAKVYKLEEVKSKLSAYKMKVNQETFRKCFLVAANLFKKSQAATSQ